MFSRARTAPWKRAAWKWPKLIAERRGRRGPARGGLRVPFLWDALGQLTYLGPQSKRRRPRKFLPFSLLLSPILGALLLGLPAWVFLKLGAASLGPLPLAAGILAAGGLLFSPRPLEFIRHGALGILGFGLMSLTEAAALFRLSVQAPEQLPGLAAALGALASLARPLRRRLQEGEDGLGARLFLVALALALILCFLVLGLEKSDEALMLLGLVWVVSQCPWTGRDYGLSAQGWAESLGWLLMAIVIP